jgi:hypothetical protein
MSSDFKGYLFICLFCVVLAFLPEEAQFIIMLPIGLFLTFCFLGAIMYFLEPILMFLFDSDEPIFKDFYDWIEKTFRMKS